jgi:hypothetical protein
MCTYIFKYIILYIILYYIILYYIILYYIICRSQGDGLVSKKYLLHKHKDLNSNSQFLDIKTGFGHLSL